MEGARDRYNRLRVQMYREHAYCLRVIRSCRSYAQLGTAGVLVGNTYIRWLRLLEHAHKDYGLCAYGYWWSLSDLARELYHSMRDADWERYEFLDE